MKHWSNNQIEKLFIETHLTIPCKQKPDKTRTVILYTAPKNIKNEN